MNADDRPGSARPITSVRSLQTAGTKFISLVAAVGCLIGCRYSGVAHYVPLKDAGGALAIAHMSEQEVLVGYGDGIARLTRVRLTDGAVIADFGRLDGAVLGIRHLEGRLFTWTERTLFSVDTQLNQVRVRCRFVERIWAVAPRNSLLVMAFSGRLVALSPSHCSPIWTVSAPWNAEFRDLLSWTSGRTLVRVANPGPRTMLLESGEALGELKSHPGLYEMGTYTHDAVALRNGRILVSGGPRQDLRQIHVGERAVEKTWSVGPFPRGIALSPDETSAYVLTTRGIAIVPLSSGDGAR